MPLIVASHSTGPKTKTSRRARAKRSLPKQDDPSPLIDFVSSTLIDSLTFPVTLVSFKRVHLDIFLVCLRRYSHYDKTTSDAPQATNVIQTTLDGVVFILQSGMKGRQNYLTIEATLCLYQSLLSFLANRQTTVSLTLQLIQSVMVSMPDFFVKFGNVSRLCSSPMADVCLECVFAKRQQYENTPRHETFIQNDYPTSIMAAVKTRNRHVVELVLRIGGSSHFALLKNNDMVINLLGDTVLLPWFLDILHRMKTVFVDFSQESMLLAIRSFFYNTQNETTCTLRTLLSWTHPKVTPDWTPLLDMFFIWRLIQRRQWPTLAHLFQPIVWQSTKGKQILQSLIVDIDMDNTLKKRLLAAPSVVTHAILNRIPNLFNFLIHLFKNQTPLSLLVQWLRIAYQEQIDFVFKIIWKLHPTETIQAIFIICSNLIRLQSNSNEHVKAQRIVKQCSFIRQHLKELLTQCLHLEDGLLFNAFFPIQSWSEKERVKWRKILDDKTTLYYDSEYMNTMCLSRLQKK